MNFRKGSHSGNRELIPVILPEVTMCYEFEEFYRAQRAEQARREMEKAKELKEIRLELVYLPSPYKEEAVNFTVSIGGQ